MEAQLSPRFCAGLPDRVWSGVAQSVFDGGFALVADG